MNPAGLAEVERVFAEAAADARVPGVAYGVVIDGMLVHAGGIGTIRVDTDDLPDAFSAFRIASMSKSFTGAAVMRLVEQGRLRLDEQVAAYAPELESWRGPTADAPPLTVRHLLWMEAGLPTDDPWADRHLDATRAQMDHLFASGGSFAWTPGTAFEYSNLGWALIARVVERVTGATVQELVREEILLPLGMAHTRWVPDELPASTEVARGYRWEGGSWLEEPPLGDGGIAPMGGLWSTVEDLARWVGFFLDAVPPRDDPEDAPLSRAGRREMQQLRRVESLEEVPSRDGAAGFVRLHGYGVGLMPTRDPLLGSTVGHSGGLPGFGSHMRWIPDRGIGLVALGNVTYAPMGRACFHALEALAHAGTLPKSRPVPPSPALVDAAHRLHRLLSNWDDETAVGLAADNLDPDRSFARRRRESEDLVSRLGDLGVPGPVSADTPLRGWIDLGEGRARAELWLNAEVPPKVQSYTIEIDPPVITQAAHLARARGAFVLLRPRGSLSQGFQDLQRGVAERPDASTPSLPSAHVTLKGFGDAGEPLSEGDIDRISGVVSTWGSATPPLRLEADGVAVLDDGQIPVVRIRADEELRAAFVDLRLRARAERLPAGADDAIADDDWIFHMSLAYPHDVNAGSWAPMLDRIRAHDAFGWHDTVTVADLIIYREGRERWIGRYRLMG
jgi:CubicO group peptidase (beta-lactamase class C family)